MKILITGARGFVGRNLIPYLVHHVERAECIPFSVRYGDSLNTNAHLYIHLAGKAHDTRNTIDEKDYYEANYLLTKDVYKKFLDDPTSECFIYMSSVKAIADNPSGCFVDENYIEGIKSVYGKSKKKAEDYIIDNLQKNKRVYILRPCMIHGPGNKGNLNLLYALVSKGLPWPLGLFENSRSYLSIENLCFIIKELIEREDILSGVYNVADDVPLSTNEVIKMIAESRGVKARILNLSKNLITVLANVGDLLKLPLNSERLQKLTESYIVSNAKIIEAIGKPLPVSSKEGLMRTFKSFSQNA